jgi:hypothetical protein
MSAYLDCPDCKDHYVISVLKFRDSAMGVVDVGMFEYLKFEDLRDNVWLENDTGVKRQLAQFKPAKGSGGESLLIFKRLDENGIPLITPSDATFKLVFSNGFRTGNNAYGNLLPSSFEFKVSKLVVDNKLIF